MGDFIFGFMSFIFIILGMNYLGEGIEKLICGGENNFVRLLVLCPIVIIYLIFYFKHKKNRQERIDQSINEVRNKYLEMIERKKD